MPDIQRLSSANCQDFTFRTSREVLDPPLVAAFSIPGEPMSKARARTGRAGAWYSPEANKNAEAAVAWKFRQATAAPVDGASEFGLIALFFTATRQRRDVDNMIKLLLDGLNKVAWDDDSQVVEVSGRKQMVWEPEDASTEVAIYRLGLREHRVGACEYCGNKYQGYRSVPGQRFCSRECHSAQLAVPRTRICEHCGGVFVSVKRSTLIKFCSRACKSAAGRVSLVCTACGKEFAKARSLALAVDPVCSAACRSTLPPWKRGLQGRKR